MEVVIVVLIGLGVVGAASRMRLLRPMAKVLIKTGMTVTEATATVASAIAEQVNDLAAHVRPDHATGTVVEEEAIHDAAGAAPAVPNWLDNTDLLQIDGIGPKVSGHLRNAGIETITQLAASRGPETAGDTRCCWPPLWGHRFHCLARAGPGVARSGQA